MAAYEGGARRRRPPPPLSKPRAALLALAQQDAEHYLRGAGAEGLTEAIRAPLNHLRLLDHRLWQVPAVAYLYKHPDDGEQALKFFQMLERLAYAMMLHFTTASARQKRYQKLTQLIQGDKPLFDRSSPLRFAKDEQKKVRERMTGRFATFGN